MRWSVVGASVALGVVAVVALVFFVGDEETAEAACPGDPGRIVFSSDRPSESAEDLDSTDFDIYCMNPDGTDLQQLTKNTTYLSEEGDVQVEEPIDDTNPTYSPDGRRIAFISNRPAPNPEGSSGDDEEEGGSTDPEIYVMDADGSNVEQITNQAPGPPSTNVEREPTWSPDGSQIAFRRGEGTDSDLFVIDLETGQERRLATGGSGNLAPDSQPAWSPDGKLIAFRKGQGVAADLYVYDLDNDQSTPLAGASESNIAEALPNWAPDGSEVAFQRGDESAGAGIYTVPAAGGQASQLTQPEPNEEGATYSDLDPAWSPDGAQIVFASNREGNYGGEHDEEGEESDAITEAVPPDVGPPTEHADVGDIELFVLTVEHPTVQTKITDNGNPEDDPATPDVDESKLGPKDITPDWQPIPQCVDGEDNDGDGRIDYPDDPGCESTTDNDETDPPADDDTPPPPPATGQTQPQSDEDASDRKQRRTTTRNRWRVRLRVSTRRPRSGQRVRFAGTVAPRHGGARLRIQRRLRDGRFRTVRRARLRRTNRNYWRFSAPVRMRPGGSGVYRALVRGTRRHRVGASNRIRIRVR